MPFVKLDSGILTSSLWQDKPARDVFITALLLARPAVYSSDIAQIEADSLKETGWSAPAGEYGHVNASGPGIIAICGMALEDGIEALKRLGQPDPNSRTSAFDGRRLIRIDGGYLILNYMRYRDKDSTNAERQRRYRNNNAVTVTHNAVTPLFASASVSASSDLLERECEGEENTPAEPHETVTRSNAASLLLQQAEQVYAEYPRKVGRKYALRFIMKSVKQHGFERIIEATKAYAKAKVGDDPQFTPNPATWFNQERFNDDPSTWIRRQYVKPVQDRNANPRNAAMGGYSDEQQARLLAEVARREQLVKDRNAATQAKRLAAEVAQAANPPPAPSGGC